MTGKIIRLALLWFVGTFILIGVATFLSLRPPERYALYVNRGTTPEERSERMSLAAARIGIRPEELHRHLLSRESHILQSRLIGTRETADFIRVAKRAGIDVGSETFKAGALNSYLVTNGDREIIMKLNNLRARMDSLRGKQQKAGGS